MLREQDFIQEGVSPFHNVVVLACTVGDDYDNPKNRVLVVHEGRWLDFGSSGDAVVSVDATSDGLAYVLGENGSLIEFNWKSPLTQAELKATRKLVLNQYVQELGPLRVVRVLGKDVVCAGSRGQVYVYRKGAFEILPRLEIDGVDGIIEDIWGTDKNSLMAVTLEGQAANFDGTVWHKIDLPTNVCLASICETESGTYVIAGNKSTLLLGQGNSWKVIDPLDPERNYYGVGFLDGKVYAAHLSGIDVYDGEELAPLPLPESPALEFAKLRGGPDGIWACAGHTVGLVSNGQWQPLT